MNKKLAILSSIVFTFGLIIFCKPINEVLNFAITNPNWLLLICLAIIIQMIGHFFRAKRTKLILDKASPSSTRFQFGMLSVGYLFNAFLPLRIGELVRSWLVARRLRISFLYTFTSVVIERCIDVLFISLLTMVCLMFVGRNYSTTLLIISLIAFVFAAVIIFAIVLLQKENKYVMSLVLKLTGCFNDSICNSFRFKVWTLISGLQGFYKSRQDVKKYFMFAGVSWIFYFTSVLILLSPWIFNMSAWNGFVVIFMPYVNAFPIFDVDSYKNMSLLVLDLSKAFSAEYTSLVWVVLTLPMAVFGLVSSFVYRVRCTDTDDNVGVQAYSNKLQRYRDISQELPAFLDTYFRGHSLSHIMHKIEVSGELSLVKFFKGGSDAITVLVLKGERMFVKKVVPIEYLGRLKQQYDWLKKFDDKKAIVDVLDEQTTDDYYAIDLSYNPSHIPSFEYVHTHSLEDSKRLLDQTWSYVFKNIYDLKKESVNVKERDEYIEDRLLNKIKKAISVDEKLARAIEGQEIKINGVMYDNFYTILEKIKKNKMAWADIATYRKSKITHGDLTMDNILVEGDKPILIDPSDDNQIKGPIVDFGRHMQSLVAGYEFLNNDESPVDLVINSELVSEINFYNHRSATYMQLCEHVENVVMKKYLTDAESRSVLFHSGLLYGRMLAHRVVINPANTLKYYAVCVVLLNKFYQQYN